MAKRLAFAGLILALTSWTLAVNAAITEQSVLTRITSVKNVPSHAGTKKAVFYKNGKEYVSVTEAYYATPFVFKFLQKAPESYKGNVVMGDGNSFILFFARQNMKLTTKINKNQEYRIDRGEQNLYLNADMKKLQKNYKVKITGKENVGNRPCLVLSISGNPFSRKLWVDAQKFFILKEKRFYNGKPTYEFSYTKIEYRKPTPSEMETKLPKIGFPLPAGNDRYIPSFASAKKQFPELPAFNSLPGKFSFDFVQHSKSVLGELFVVVATDGLTDLRIAVTRGGVIKKFMEKIFGDKAKEFQKDAVNYSPLNFAQGDESSGDAAMGPSVSGEFPLPFLEKIFKEVFKK